MIICGREMKFYCAGRLIWPFIRLPKLDSEGSIALRSNTKPTRTWRGRNFPRIWWPIRFAQMGCLITFMVYLSIFLKARNQESMWMYADTFWDNKQILSGILAGYAFVTGALSLHGGTAGKWTAKLAPLITIFEIIGVVVSCRVLAAFDRSKWMHRRVPVVRESYGYDFHFNDYDYEKYVWNEKPLQAIIIVNIVLWSITLAIAFVVAATHIAPFISDLHRLYHLDAMTQDRTREDVLDQRLCRIEEALGIEGPVTRCRDCKTLYDVHAAVPRLSEETQVGDEQDPLLVTAGIIGDDAARMG